MTQDLDALRGQFRQLAELNACGVIDAGAFEQSRRELERRILEAVMSGPVHSGPAVAVRPVWRAPRAMWTFVGVLAAASLLYGWKAASGERIEAPPSTGLTLESLASQVSALSSVGGRVTISPQLLAKASPEDAVFVFARSTDGSRMPLAAMRRQVKDLPFDFRLDDSMAMAPEATLSTASTVVVTARVSRSGDATPSAGDLFGSSVPVAVGSSGLALEINEIVAK